MSSMYVVPQSDKKFEMGKGRGGGGTLTFLALRQKQGDQIGRIFACILGE
jgi:hypothetical protein